MLRSDLIKLLSERFAELTKKDVTESVAEILGAITSTLAKGGRVEISDFGSFNMNYMKPKLGRNPSTGAKVPVPAKYRVHFKSSKLLREIANGKLSIQYT
jgi:integration host factor subunit beta